MFFRERRSEDQKSTYAVLPLREVVVFPHTPMSLIVGRPRSVAAVNAANRDRREILLVSQKNAERLEPNVDDLYLFGTLATIEQTLRLPDGNTKVLVEGRRRARVLRFVDNPDHFVADVEEIPAPGPASVELQALVRTVKGAFERYVKVNRAVPAEMLLAINAMENPDRLADALVAPLGYKLAERQEILEIVDPMARLERIYKTLLTEIEFLQVERKLKTRVKREREHGQREQWLSDQMKQIQREIGDKEGRGELEELAQAIAAKDLPDPVQDRAQKELRKLSQMNLLSAEATVVRNYLDWILALPWSERGENAPSVADAAKILDEDHFGLERIKERILEYIAVSALVDKMRGPILCLVGPPGVGKTSLARSIARATGRPFARIALGGVRDEAEIRGHRRTYIGAMPGKILHAMKRAGRTDPVLLLDEVDKMSADFRGDPAAALLEVLDPEQNTGFNDHYMDLDYDLSEVLFICTANTLQGIPVALQDRLEILELSGYTEPEKLGIARRYLLPKQREMHGLQPGALELTDAAILEVVRRYTKESGVRELERQIARVCRKIARKLVEDKTAVPLELSPGAIEPLLGAQRFEIGAREADDQVGLVKGLAVSPWGGELLNVEVATVPGKGNLILTGRLGDWLKESATAAFTYVRSRAEALHLDPEFHTKEDFHVHYPGNPLRTDGPSAGITMAVALVSTLTEVPVRADTAMTGEISLRGRVLPIGGVKEKVMAAHRGGITRVILPEGNRKDLEDIPPAVREAMEFVFVSHMDRVLQEALVRPQPRLPAEDYQEAVEGLPAGRPPEP